MQMAGLLDCLTIQRNAFMVWFSFDAWISRLETDIKNRQMTSYLILVL